MARCSFWVRMLERAGNVAMNCMTHWERDVDMRGSCLHLRKKGEDRSADFRARAVCMDFQSRATRLLHGSLVSHVRS